MPAASGVFCGSQPNKSTNNTCTHNHTHKERERVRERELNTQIVLNTHSLTHSPWIHQRLLCSRGLQQCRAQGTHDACLPLLQCLDHGGVAWPAHTRGVEPLHEVSEVSVETAGGVRQQTNRVIINTRTTRTTHPSD